MLTNQSMIQTNICIDMLNVKLLNTQFLIFFSVAVVVAFFLCWAPFHAQRLMATYVVHQTPTAVTIYTILTHISGVTYYVSATINPILYSIMSKKFRHAFKDTLAHCCRKNPLSDISSLRYSKHPSTVSRSSQSSFMNNNFRKKSFFRNQEHDSYL